MTIAEALRAVNDEYNDECLRTRNNAAFNELVASAIGGEYEEIDQELPSYVGEILAALDMPPGIVDPRYYQMARMCFRMGMRVQRKLDQPNKKTTMFWRSDQRSA
jgi:hypothetical protein